MLVLCPLPKQPPRLQESENGRLQMWITSDLIVSGDRHQLYELALVILDHLAETGPDAPPLEEVIP